MKKTLLLSLLALLSLASAFAQQKSVEYGFSLKGGTYTAYKKGSVMFTYAHTDLVYRPGYSAATGVYGKCRMGRWLALSAELAYGFAEFRAVREAYFPTLSFPSLTAHYEKQKQIQRYVAHNLLLPVNLHVGRGLSSRLSGYVGLAPMYNLEMTTSFEIEAPKEYPTQPQKWEYDRQPGSKDPRWQWLLSAGLEYRLGQHYALGLQMLLNQQSLDTTGGFSYTPGDSPVPMKSLTATLRHSL